MKKINLTRFGKYLSAITLLLITIPCFSQQTQFIKENHKQSLLQKYSIQLNEMNEIVSLRTMTSQHFKVEEDFFIALIYCSPAYFNHATHTLSKINADTTIVAPSSGRVFKQGASLTKYGNRLRIQNTDSYGCENGYRSWVKFNVSSLPDSANVVWVEQHIFCTELHEGFFDYLNYDIRRIDNDPETATPLELWSDVFDGAVYEAGEWVSNPPDWEWCLLDAPAASDLTAALTIHDWFGLGYMVKCNEDDGDYYAVFKGAQDDLPPYLVIGYNYVTEVEHVPASIESFALYQNYPNPFNPKTTIRYQIASQSYVEVKVFDVLGREIVTLINEEQASGIHEVEFNGTELASGLYIYKIQGGDFVETKKMILLK